MIPFLLQFAEKPVVEDRTLATSGPETPDQSDAQRAEQFHTRCGHPRHRDD